MDLKTLKKHLLGRPGATEGAAFGPEHLTYKVMGKLFAVVSWDEEPMRISLKCDPTEVEAFMKMVAEDYEALVRENESLSGLVHQLAGQGSDWVLALGIPGRDGHALQVIRAIFV